MLNKKINRINCQINCVKSYAFSGHSYGNYFDPAKDCSHVVDNVPKPESGVYWIQTKKGPIKVRKIMRNELIKIPCRLLRLLYLMENRLELTQLASINKDSLVSCVIIQNMTKIGTIFN